MAKGNIVRWITVKGRRIPIYEDGSMGGFMEGKQHQEKSEGRKTYRVYYEDGNQKLLEANSKEELDAYLKEHEKENGKVSRTETADENDAYDREHKEGKYSDTHRSKTGPLAHMTDDQVMEAALQGDRNAVDEMSKRGLSTTKDLQEYKNRQKGSKSLEDHSDIQRIAEEHVKKIWNGGAANRELYDAAEKWAEEHNFDKNKARDAAFAAMNKKQMAEIKRREGEKGSKPSLNDIKGYGYDPHDATGDPTIITADGRSYYKIGDDKWVAHSDSGRTLSGSISDKQMAERLANAKDVKVNPAAKPNKSIKVGDKDVAVNKTRPDVKPSKYAEKTDAKTKSRLEVLGNYANRRVTTIPTDELPKIISKLKAAGMDAGFYEKELKRRKK